MRAVVIDKEVIARAHIEPVIDADILFDERIFPERAEQLAQNLFAEGKLRALRCVEAVAKLHGADVRLLHFGVAVVVRFPRL